MSNEKRGGNTKIKECGKNCSNMITWDNLNIHGQWEICSWEVLMGICKGQSHAEEDTFKGRTIKRKQRNIPEH